MPTQTQFLEKWQSYDGLLYKNGSLCRSKSLIYLSEGSLVDQEPDKLESNTESEKLHYLTKSQKKTLVILVLVDFICFCAASVMAPFFPREAAKKGLTNTMTGFVFAFYSLIMFVTSPIFGKIIPLVDAKILFIVGITLTGTCNVLFGLLEFVEDRVMFIVFCFLVQGFQALGASAFSTASYVFAIHTFPDNIGAVLGLLETFVGLGMSIGPAIGGLLYTLGGFKLPFFVLGTGMLLIVPLNVFILPAVKDIVVDSEGTSTFKLLKVPSILITGLVIVVVSSLWGFLDPTLEPHLRQFNLSPEQVGSIFLLFSALYGISSPLWGALTDKFNHHWCMMVWGLIFCTVALILLGPCPYIPVLANYKSLGLNLTAISALGVSIALVLMPTFQRLLKSAEDGGFNGSLTTHSLVAGIWSCMYSLGEVVGPSLGGFLLQKYDFPLGTTIMAFLTFFMAVILCFFFCVTSIIYGNRSHVLKNRIKGCEMEDTERTPLLSRKVEYGNRSYIQNKVYNYSKSRKIDDQNGMLDRNQVTDIRGTVAITFKGSCEA